MGAEEGAVGGILGQLRRLELIGATAFTGTLLGLFAFGLSHGGETSIKIE